MVGLDAAGKVRRPLFAKGLDSLFNRSLERVLLRLLNRFLTRSHLSLFHTDSVSLYVTLLFLSYRTININCLI